MATTRAWKIYRRAYSKYELVAMTISTWAEAEDFATKARVINEYDGEYFVRAMGERPEGYEIEKNCVFYNQ